ncbi:MAG: Hpt domain-containing protein, partial [Cyanobacteria bacterium J06560_2]
MMIEDEELRALYQTTCRGRVQALASGLLTLPATPEAAQLEALRREAHSLKGDSRVMGLEDIGTLAHHVEIVIKDLQQQAIEWRSPLTERVEETLKAITQLVECATTGAAVEVDAPRIGSNLQAAMVATGRGEARHHETTVAAGDLASEPDSLSGKADLTVLSSCLVADADMRSLYASTSDRRLQTLQRALEALAKSPEAPSTLATFRDEIQGVKGDAREVGQGAIAAIAQKIVAIANRLILQKNELTPALQSSLWQGLQFIEQLVSVAIDERSSERLPSSPTREALTQFFAELEANVNQSYRASTGRGEAGNTISITTSITTDLIADDELRSIYKDTSEARLQRLEAGFLQLEKEPQNGAALQSIIHETHSLKGDAQSTGIAPVATLAEGVEIVLNKIQRQEIGLNSELNNAFRESLMAMGALVQNATMGSAIAVNATQLSQNLLAIASQAGPPDVSLTAADTQMAEGHQIDDFFSEQQGSERATDAVGPNAENSAIEDEELRDVYRTVSAERLQRLEIGLEALAGQPSDADAIAALLRETHSLKGDARSVGLDSVASLSHAIETLFVGLQDQTLALSAELGDVLYRGVDAIAQLIDGAITGLPASQVNTPLLLQQLQDAALAAPLDSQTAEQADSQ